jgi:hypothetical protein
LGDKIGGLPQTGRCRRSLKELDEPEQGRWDRADADGEPALSYP